MLSKNTSVDPFSSRPKQGLAAQRRRLPAAVRGQPLAVSGVARLGILTTTVAGGTGSSSVAINSGLDQTKIKGIDPETGEIITFEQRGDEFVQSPPTPEASRQASYSLLGAFKRVLPKHRTAQCLWAVVEANKTVQVIKDIEAQRARYNNLRVCGRVWTCPVCSRKTSQFRGQEIKSAIDVAKAQGLKVALLTCTVPHVIHDDLSTLLARLLKSWRSFIADRVGKTIKADMGIVGTIRNIECTHGDNGWHPHFHCLVFYKNDVDLAEMEARFAANWQHACVKSGLRRPSDKHGLTLQNGDYVANYMSKWGLEHEMTKSMHKVARSGGRTPFDILRDYEQGLDKDENAILFREFVQAFHGMRQLYWSNGLKKLLAVVEITDEEIAVLETDRATELICELQIAQWKLVRPLHRATLLTLAEKNPAAIPEFLASLEVRLQQPPY